MEENCGRTPGDGELALAVQAGAPEAFDQLSARYLGLLRARAGQFARPGGLEKEDLIQEGFLGLYAAAMAYNPQGGASFGTYAGVCVYNRMASAARSHHSVGNRPLNESLPLDTAGDLPQLGGQSPEELLELRENAQAFWRRAQTLLTPLERRALGLYLGGWRREEIAEKAGMSLKTFDNALHRVRKKLKDR
ncbi:sigma-70 family RNA polymerase sigma factor [Acutalibacter sp. 1XD8-33]|uniref:sigma-70 family RNA polymerase sigma factor n=1 Tax=Acutalibacter sp. 1XD8-33 TaxID=2320081 RepID=UPI000EA26BEA|nr:sigma-70 family RNA polymerase sigma factor [Acutalibacter sp. 1XD8-33]RKJ38552.1 sigma-70 family RNA polymerase sigma factor [Acutalibacter sp. 1XD8-33]